MLIRSISLIFITVLFFFPAVADDDVIDAVAVGNATESSVPVNGSLAKDSFADMFDRALQKEFPESEQNSGETDAGSFNNSVAEKQDVTEEMDWDKTGTVTFKEFLI